MARWLEKDAKALEEMKKIIQTDLDAYPPYLEVVGDRRLLRFIGGFNGNVEKAAEAYLKFLKWRIDNNVDEIRNNILYGGVNHPKDFPQGELILKVIPQIVISPHAFDRHGQPLTLEIYSFDPTEVLNTITIDEYLIFLIYSLEFRTLILEQIADEREAKYVKEHQQNLPDGYGNMHILKLCCLRDLNGVGFKHLGSKTKSILKVALDIALPNYPEYLGKSHMVNVPWIFETLWVFVKGLLDEGILKKIALLGVNFMDELMKDIPYECIPQSLGGSLPNDNWGFDFDTSTTGLFSPDKLIKANVKLPKVGLTVATGPKHPSDSDRQYISMQNGIPVNSYSDSKSSYTMALNGNTDEVAIFSSSSSSSSSVQQEYMASHSRSRRGSICSSLNDSILHVGNSNSSNNNVNENSISNINSSSIHARRSQSFSAKDLMASSNIHNNNHNGGAGIGGDTASVDSKTSSAFRTSSIPVFPNFIVNSVNSVNHNVNALFFPHTHNGNISNNSNNHNHGNTISSAHTSIKVSKSMKSPAKKHHQFSTLETPRSVSTADDAAAVVLDEYDKYSNVNEINRKTLRQTDKDHVHTHSSGSSGLLTLHAPKFGTNPFATIGNYALPTFSVPNAFSLNTSTSRTATTTGAASPAGVHANTGNGSSTHNNNNTDRNSRLNSSGSSVASSDSVTTFSPGKPIPSSSSSSAATSSSTIPQVSQSVASSIKTSVKQSSSSSSLLSHEYEETTKPSYTYGVNDGINHTTTDAIKSLTSISEVIASTRSNRDDSIQDKKRVTISSSSSSSGSKRDVSVQTMESSFSSAAIKRSQMNPNITDHHTNILSSSSSANSTASTSTVMNSSNNTNGLKKDSSTLAAWITNNNTHEKLAITISPMAFVLLASVAISALYFADYHQMALTLAAPMAIYILFFFFSK